MRGISTLKYFGLSKDYSNSIYKTSEDFRKETMGALRIAMLSTFALDFCKSFGCCCRTFLGLRLMSGDILLFPALAALILAPEYFLPLRDFASDYHATLNGKNALAAVNEVLSTEENTLSVLTEKVTWSANSQLQLTELGKIYDTGRGISNVILSVNGFKKIAIVGNSGSGKSTLLSMLAGFLKPTAGEIKLNEQSLTSLTDENYRQSVQFIPQKTYIFAGTFRENLAFYEPDSTDDEIKAAAKLAGLESLIDEIGLDGQIGASGRTISGGQAQRVALARAFLSHTRNILFLDEPTAHLDIETELEIKANILPLLENKLVFIATHRLHWLSSMDLVIVLNEGQVAGIGTPEQLLSENTYYQKLLSQMRGVDDDKNLLDNETSESVKDQEEKESERSNFSSVNDKSTDSSVSQASSDNGVRNNEIKKYFVR